VSAGVQPIDILPALHRAIQDTDQHAAAAVDSPETLVVDHRMSSCPWQGNLYESNLRTGLGGFDFGGMGMSRLRPEDARKEVERRLHTSKVTARKELDLSPNEKKQALNLGYVPDEVFQMTQLKRLDLSNNTLAELPPEIGKLTNLEYLNVGASTESGSENQLSTLPPEIGKLTQLKTLLVGHNQLTALPSEIGQLSQLEELYIGSKENQFTGLPPEIGQLSRLRVLDCSFGYLRVLPSEIGKLTNLTHLALNNNQLISIPPEIGQLTQLRTLTLASNSRLTTIPHQIERLPNLRTLTVSGDLLDAASLAMLQRLRARGVLVLE